jgi:molybdate transport system substrate-binding protein
MKRAWFLAVLALALISCSREGDVVIRVSAASSLKDAFGELEAVFEESNPGVDIMLNLAASSTLREQILSGAPVDVFASADVENMEQVASALELEPIVFATNTMAIAVPTGNPGGVTGLAALARDDLFVGLCGESVPCGILAREVLANGAVTPSIDTNEPNVRSLLTKVETGELDVGIVYSTDVKSSTEVEAIPVPAEWNVTTDLPIAVLPAAHTTGSDFVSFVLSSRGREILADRGFGIP